MTIAEKILSAHSGKKAVSSGEVIVAAPDFILGQDGTSPRAIEVFETLGLRQVFCPEKIAMVIDHSAPSPSLAVSRKHQTMRTFAARQKIHLHDVGDGICHQVVPEEGYVKPGDLVIGADSHTCTYGALGVFSIGVGATDMAVAMASGNIWLEVPKSIKIIINGKLPRGVYAKDVILYIIGELTASGASEISVEFYGDTISEMSIAGRFTIANMVREMGAQAGLMLVDEKCRRWLGEHGVKDFTPVAADNDALYTDVKEYDASLLFPQVTRPHSVDNAVPVNEVEGIAIDEAVIGTCTNGREEDFHIAAEILKGRKVATGVRLIIAPASRKVFLNILKEGIVESLVESGAAFVTPGCGPCCGTHNGVPADGETVISTANRNFKGRMGNPQSLIFLASPATVAASAIEGHIADPRKYL
ncbi:3-isopropylmalate dehydratase large subunit [candidate division NPL-UPA2 bacterium Unc8]|uniref:3-isopropylmalate dehydratase large subunit n=1 Tax=candidate division NPL-UPA2 bacterium Unc8 TaxID=1980939 RepID=A0A399FTT2_UNCN2|nr:MAG: 3-isopropylmalate dehydratase large subunit [candidate division NPL-UPA2 bacterium Unc8]